MWSGLGIFPEFNRKIVKTGTNSIHMNTWPLTFLTWYRHLNKKWRDIAYFTGSHLPSEKIHITLLHRIYRMILPLATKSLPWYTYCLCIVKKNECNSLHKVIVSWKHRSLLYVVFWLIFKSYLKLLLNCKCFLVY